ncbi:MAG: ligase-associated DNA damage response exonuclease [Ignavibacteriaceae bacterium]|nr:ligase-associated DNA damage response exonuclease [Ignavibacteriaceae bacterium]
MNNTPLVRLTDKGLFCEAGGFYVDPSKSVDKALITHAHSDHARPGSKSYLTVKQGGLLLKHRLGRRINIETINYNQEISLDGVKVSFHPAGHILGSSQIRIEYKGEVWVISGDYKIEEDFTCEKFAPVKCHTFITESTFGLPIYKWAEQKELFNEINSWWKRNKEAGITSIIFSYALGKSQRVIAGLDESIGPIYTHPAVEDINVCYRESGIKLSATKNLNEFIDEYHSPGAMVIAPPSTDFSQWANKFHFYSSAFVSGWMLIRKNRKRTSFDRGFPLSDHADWEGLLQGVKHSEADRILVTHGFSSPFVKWLREEGINAEVLQ